jgi:pimeloyl-ACP methyl ester carboxylesterase
MPPPALAVVAPGFMLPPSQYNGYVDLLEELGMPTVVVADRSSLAKGVSLEEGARALLAAGEAEAQRLQLDASTPLVLVAHSRGAKLSVMAASASTRPIGALVLLDPVDATIFDDSTAMPTLRTLGVPTAVVGSGAGAGECAPPGGNYATYFESLGTSGAPKLLATLPHAGHTQVRRSLSIPRPLGLPCRCLLDGGSPAAHLEIR